MLSELDLLVLKTLKRAKCPLTVTEICRIVNGMSATSCLRLSKSKKLRRGKYRLAGCEECKYRYQQVLNAIKKLERKGLVKTRIVKLSDEYEPRGYDFFRMVELSTILKG